MKSTVSSPATPESSPSAVTCQLSPVVLCTVIRGFFSSMLALLGAGCVGASSIAQGVAGTSLTRCFGFHAASFVSSGTARNVHLHTGADK